MTIQRESAILLVPMVITWALDVTLTLAFQPAAYWAGDYAQAQEYTDVWRFLMVRHPLLFLAGCSVEIAVCCFAALALRPCLGRYVATALTIGNTSAFFTWLVSVLPVGSLLVYCPQFLIGVCLMVCLERSIRWQQDAAKTCRAKDGGPVDPGAGWTDPQDALPQEPEHAHGQLQPR